MASTSSYVVAISGVSSSGKTTLARLLRDIWPRTTVLHQDDFYWPDHQIPVNAQGVQDWDCVEAFDMKKLQASVDYIQSHRALPPDFVSKEDQNAIGESGIDETLVEKWKQTATQLDCEVDNGWQLFVVDGILLFSERTKETHSLFDLKLLLCTGYETAKSRRESRAGYVTIEGFWEDPPGYVDDVVWPNYVKEHSYLFVDGNVEDNPDPSTCSAAGIMPVPSAAKNDVNATLDWACSALKELLSRRCDNTRNSSLGAEAIT